MAISHHLNLLLCVWAQATFVDLMQNRSHERFIGKTRSLESTIIHNNCSIPEKAKSSTTDVLIVRS